MDALSGDDVRAALADLPAWTFAPDARSISCDLRFADFTAAFAFMTAVALDAQAADHHPDWSNSWATVSISLTTHAAGGLTELDLALARRVDAHAAALSGSPGGSSSDFAAAAP